MHPQPITSTPRHKTRYRQMILKEGQPIGEKWHVVYLIKENPYAESYRIEDESGNPYFMKIYRLKNTPEKLILPDGDVAEIAACRQLNHKNIVSYIADGTYQDEAGECRYLIATYFSGELLSEMLHREGRLDKDTAVKIFVEMLEGLQYLHERPGVLLHNDINPTNVMLSSKTGGVAELIDMGHLSPCFMGNPPFDTADLDPRYASGQSFLGKYDERNDVFGAAAVLYTMLTGKAPWDVEFAPGMSRKEKIRLVQKARSEQGEINVDDIEDVNLQAVVACGMSLSYTERYETIDEMLADVLAEDQSEMAKEILNRLASKHLEASASIDDDELPSSWGSSSETIVEGRQKDGVSAATRTAVHTNSAHVNIFPVFAHIVEQQKSIRRLHGMRTGGVVGVSSQFLFRLSPSIQIKVYTYGAHTCQRSHTLLLVFSIPSLVEMASGATYQSMFPFLRGGVDRSEDMLTGGGFQADVLHGISVILPDFREYGLAFDATVKQCVNGQAFAYFPAQTVFTGLPTIPVIVKGIEVSEHLPPFVFMTSRIFIGFYLVQPV